MPRAPEPSLTAANASHQFLAPAHSTQGEESSAASSSRCGQLPAGRRGRDLVAGPLEPDGIDGVGVFAEQPGDLGAILVEVVGRRRRLDHELAVQMSRTSGGASA